MGFLVEGHVGVFTFGFAACFLVGAQLHLPKCFMAELEKFLRLARYVPSGGFPDRPPQFLPLLLLHFILALGPDVPFGDELDINIIGKLFLLLGVGTDAVLHAHAIHSLRVVGAEFGGEFFDFFEEFVLLGEYLVDIVADGVEGLVVLEAVVLVMGGSRCYCGFGAG